MKNQESCIDIDENSNIIFASNKMIIQQDNLYTYIKYSDISFVNSNMNNENEILIFCPSIQYTYTLCFNGTTRKENVSKTIIGKLNLI